MPFTSHLKIPVTNSGTGKIMNIVTARFDTKYLSGFYFDQPYGSFSNVTLKVGEFISGTMINDTAFQSVRLSLSNGNYIGDKGGYTTLFSSRGAEIEVMFEYLPNFDKPFSSWKKASFFAKYKEHWIKVQVTGKGNNSEIECNFFYGTVFDEHMRQWLDDVAPEPIIPEPWGPESKPGGGGGTFDPGGDQIKNPGTPSAGAGGSGFVSLYQPTVAQVKSLYNFLWSDLVSVDTFKKLFNDPMEALISFAAVPALSKAGVRKNIFFGNLDTGIESVEIGQYQHLDCGSIKLAEFFGSALDYAPYTQLTIFLPYVGYQELNVNDYMGKDIGVEYTVDMLSGACIAFVKAGTTIVSQFAGNCLSPIPITARDQNDIYKGALSAAAVVAGAVAMVATAGTAAPAVGAAVTTAGTPAAGAAAAGLGAKGVALAAGGALTAANIATTSRPHYQRSGSINGASGMLGIQTPYLIIERPDQSLAHDYNKFVGFPSNLTLKLGELAGFTQVESIRLDGFAGASAAEISEIDSLLKSGVIL